MEIKLTPEALKAISVSGLLYGEIAEELDVRPGYLKRILLDNDKRLTQAGVVAIIKKHKPDFKDKDIFIKIPTPSKVAA